MLAKKTLKDIWNYLLLFPLTLLTLYYLPLTLHLYSHREIYPIQQASDFEKLKRIYGPTNFKALTFFVEARAFFYDHAFP